jgi:hypothetical protein
MTEKILTTPILVTAFNRPDNLQKIFTQIRKVKPKQFFLAVDGPRPDKPGEAEKCKESQDIIKQIDWPCEVHTLFQTKNLGCGMGVAMAFKWYFEHVPEGIIMEDDSFADETFFFFCQDMLEYYRNNPKIMHISGTSFQKGHKRGDDSYYFSEYALIWGWATWRRAFQYYNMDYVTPRDYGKAWYYSIKDQDGLCVAPNVNLVTNIGFGPGATNTTETGWPGGVPTTPMVFPLVHPTTIRRHVIADLYTNKHLFGIRNRSDIFGRLLEKTPDSLKPFMSYTAKAIKKIWP